MLVDRAQIEPLDGPKTYQRVTPDLVAEVSLRRTNWTLPEVLAWVATRDHEQVAQIACDGAWRPSTGVEPPPGVQVFEEHRQCASIGWLVRSVSLRHCQCGARQDDEREAWETCSCTVAAFNSVFDHVQRGKLYAFDQSTSSPLDAALLPGFALDPSLFKLRAPYHPASVSFRRVDVERIWPAPKRREQLPRLSESDLNRWWSSLPNPDMMPESELMVAIAEKFPAHAVSRHRIRALMGERKRGPKPNRRKITAE
jgi:hypothetical protein